MEKKTAYIALGGNVGNRSRTLLTAVCKMDETDGIEVRQVSQFVETEPVGPPGQPKYYNAAAEILTTLSPHELLEQLHRIEAELGRNREKEQRWGARTCDLDILLMERTVIDEPEGLKIPHPRLHERLFVLRPLAQLAPDAIHPTLKRTVVELLIDAEVGKGDAS